MTPSLHMRMRRSFEAAHPQVQKYIWRAEQDEYLYAYPLDPNRQALSGELNVLWRTWKLAWRDGQLAPEISDEIIEALLDERYTVKDFNRLEGEVDIVYALSNNFVTREEGRDFLRLAFERFEQLTRV